MRQLKDSQPDLTKILIYKTSFRIGYASFVDGFEAEIAYQLRERNPATLEDMQKVVVDVETNLLLKRTNMQAERKEAVKEEFSPLSNHKLDIVIKAMEI